jgi:hypothetical protein
MSIDFRSSMNQIHQATIGQAYSVRQAMRISA